MKVIVRFTAAQERLALPILLRKNPGMVLRDRTYVLDDSTLLALAREGVRFTELSREGETHLGELSGERI